MRKILFLLIAMLSLNANAQRSIKGEILDAQSRKPMLGVSVYLPDYKIGTVTDSLGRFEFQNISVTKILLQVSYIGYRTNIQSISTSSSLTIEMEPAATEINEVVVTGTSKASEQKRTPSPITVVSSKMLTEIASTNIIDALASQPGVAQITTGSGISKPVIRGLGYNRVLVVNDGVRQEGQQWGDEHGVEVDPYNVERVEILKGPASLAYGSDAMAGVINLISAPFPGTALQGSILSEYQTNNGLIGTSANLDGSIGELVWNVRSSGRLAHDYRNRADGYVFNSGFREHSFSTQIGIKKSWGYTSLTLGYYLLKPGIVEGDRDSLSGLFIREVNLNGIEKKEIVNHAEHKSYNPDIPFQRVGHYRAVLNSYIHLGDGTLKSVIGFQQNRRKEFGKVLEPSIPDLYFKLNTISYDFQFQLPELFSADISVGINGMIQNSQNLGEEVLVPEYDLFDFGLFTILKKNFGKLDLAGGVRLDSRQLHSKGLMVREGDGSGFEEKFRPFSNSFNGFSGSIGATYQLSRVAYTKVNVSSGYRSPTIAELGSNGVHEGTLRYEVGNSDLKPERSLQLDWGIGFATEHISAELNLFSNHVGNFIFLHKLTSSLGTDSTINGSSVFKFSDGNAALWGGEVRIDFHPHPLDWIHFENSFSYVAASLKNQSDTSKYLPFTPAPKWLSSVRFDFRRIGSYWQKGFLRFDVESTFAQNRVYSAYNTETKTAGYVLLNVVMGIDFTKRGDTKASLQVGINNIADKVYQSHLSRLKYAPVNYATGRTGVFNMGRNISVKLLIPIGG